MTADLPVSQAALAARIRSLLEAGSQRFREVRMFGGLAFMVEDAMAVAAGRDGSILVRVDPARYDELLGAGGSPALMGRDRPMGEGWLTVAAERIEAEADLARWIGVGIDARHRR